MHKTVEGRDGRWTIDSSLGFGATLAVALLFCFVQSGECARETWENIGVYGGDITDVAVDPFDPNHLLGGSRHESHQSFDRGETWAPLSTFQFEDAEWRSGMRGEVIVFDPSMAGRVYNGSYVSEDSGHTWRVLDDQKKVLAVSPEDPDLLFAGTGLYNELYRSTDRGLTWTTLFTLEWQVYYFRDVEFDPSDATRVLVAVQSSVGASLQGISGRVYESHDGGESFSIVLEGVYPGVDPSELANPELARNAAVEPKQIVFDGDDVFMPCSGGLLRYDGQDFARLTFDYSQGVCIAADGAVYLLIQKGFEEPPDWIPVYNTAGLLSEINVLYRSENRGQDLEAVSAFEGAFGLSVDPTDAQRLYANGAGVLVSDDRGVHWRGSHQGIENVSINDIAWHPRKPQRIVAASSMGIHVSRNNGSKWTSYTFPYVDTITFADEAGDIILASSLSHAAISLDGGETWQGHNLGSPHRSTMIADPAQPGRVYVGGADIPGETVAGLYLLDDVYRFPGSEDADLTWFLFSTEPGDIDEFHIAHYDGDTLLWMAAETGLYLLVNDGELQRLSDPVEHLDGSLSDPLSVFVSAGTEAGWVEVQKDENGQYSLAAPPSLAVPDYAAAGVTIRDAMVFDNHSDHLVMATDQGIFKSTNRGETWHKISEKTGAKQLFEMLSEVRQKRFGKTSASVPTSDLVIAEEGGAYRKVEEPVSSVEEYEYVR